jgi:hypothetical protein
MSRQDLLYVEEVESISLYYDIEHKNIINASYLKNAIIANGAVRMSEFEAQCFVDDPRQADIFTAENEKKSVCCHEVRNYQN